MAFRYVKNRSEILNRCNFEPAILSFSYAGLCRGPNCDKSKYFSILTSQHSEILGLGINLSSYIKN